MSKDHPSYEVMVYKTIQVLKQRKGSTRFAIKKYILANYHLNSTWVNNNFGRMLNTLVMKKVITKVNVHTFKITDEYKKKYIKNVKVSSAKNKKRMKQSLKEKKEKTSESMKKEKKEEHFSSSESEETSSSSFFFGTESD